MAVLKCYLDESGKEEDPQHDAVTVGGFIADETTWTAFEPQWAKVLNDEGVTSLHMKYFAHSKKEFQGWKGDEPRRKAFLGRLVSVIRDNKLRGYVTTIRKEDLNRFNNEKGINIEALPLCIYLCLCHIYCIHEHDKVELIFDTLEKHNRIFEEANRLASTHPNHDVHRVITALDGKDFNSSNVLPIQAADFLAWEALKHHREMSGWFSECANSTPWEEWDDSLKSWLAARGPNQRARRKSFGALLEAGDVYGGMCNYFTLCHLDRVRRGSW